MSERTDKQLADIVTTKRNEYQPEAILAAEKEIALRKIDLAKFHSENESADYIPEEMEKEDLPFEWYHKILTVSFPIFIIILFIWVNNILGGYKIGGPLGFAVIIMTHRYIHQRLKENGYLKLAEGFKNWGYYTIWVYLGTLLVFGTALLILL